jgi:predicted 3-demethylubiquinone-9 3-methyltransferase (glyoxalase superfamily)
MNLSKYFALALLGVLLATSMLGQSRELLRVAENVANITDPYVKWYGKPLPDSLKNESAVILDDITLYTIEKKKGLEYTYYVRYIVRILDKTGLEEYSVIDMDAFRQRSYANVTLLNLNKYAYDVAVRIRKPSGKVEFVDLTTLQRNSENETPIPGLEIGDDLEFLLEKTSFTYESCLSPFFDVLTDDYVVLNGYQRYTVDRGFFVNYKASNGAPELKKNESLSDRKSIVYELQYENQPTQSNESWSLRYRSEPSYKMQFCYEKLGNVDNTPEFLVDPYEVTTVVSDQKKLESLNRIYRGKDYPKSMAAKFFEKWFDANYDGEQLTNDEIMQLAYYHIRYYTLIYQSSIKDYNSKYHEQVIKGSHFRNFMGYVADKFGIEYEIVFTSDRGISTFDDIVMFDEIEQYSRYKSDNGDWVYLNRPRSFQTMDHIPNSIRGQEGFSRKIGTTEYSDIVIPFGEYQKNISISTMDLEMDLNSKVVSVQMDRKFSGEPKFEVSGFILDNEEYIEDCEKAMLFGRETDKLLSSNNVQRQRDRAMEKMEVDEERKFKKMKESREGTFEIDEYTRFELKNSGVISTEDTLHYSEAFTIKNAMEKVGPSTVLNLGEIAFNQVSLTEEEIAQRRTDIYFNFPKSLKYVYTVKIPEGYKVKGYTSLNETAENEVGSVHLKSEVKDDKVILELHKVYKAGFVPKEDWEKVVEFIRPAMKMNSAKLVFTK